MTNDDLLSNWATLVGRLLRHCPAAADRSSGEPSAKARFALGMPNEPDVAKRCSPVHSRGLTTRGRARWLASGVDMDQFHRSWCLDRGRTRFGLAAADYSIVGVEIFFAISGYIITHLLLRERARTGGIDLRGFWYRRALRIVPPLLAASIGIGLSAALGHQRRYWRSFFGALSLTVDTPLVAGDWFFGHMWSLALEEQFYLVWPLLPALRAGSTRRLGGCVCCGCSALLAVSPRWLPKLENILPYLSYLGVGCLLALLMAHRPAWLRGRRRSARPCAQWPCLSLAPRPLWPGCTSRGGGWQ